MMKTKPFYSSLALSLFLVVFINTTGYAGEHAPRYHVQGMLGRMTIDEGDFLLEGATEADDPNLFEGDPVHIPMLGASVQRMLGGDRFEYGVEGGGLFSWDTDRWGVFISNGGAYIHLETSILLADLFFGGYMATDIGERLRFYIGAGPLIIYGQQKIDPDYPTIEPHSPYKKNTKSDWDVGLYARTGIEFRFTEKLIAGLGVRWIQTQLNLNNSGGKSEVEGIQVLFTLAATLNR